MRGRGLGRDPNSHENAAIKTLSLPQPDNYPAPVFPNDYPAHDLLPQSSGMPLCLPLLMYIHQDSPRMTDRWESPLGVHQFLKAVFEHLSSGNVWNAPIDRDLRFGSFSIRSRTIGIRIPRQLPCGAIRSFSNPGMNRSTVSAAHLKIRDFLTHTCPFGPQTVLRIPSCSDQK